jgi:hypothetical protein
VLAKPSKVEALLHGRTPRRGRTTRPCHDLSSLSGEVEAVAWGDRSIQQCPITSGGKQKPANADRAMGAGRGWRGLMATVCLLRAPSPQMQQRRSTTRAGEPNDLISLDPAGAVLAGPWPPSARPHAPRRLTPPGQRRRHRPRPPRHHPTLLDQAPIGRGRRRTRWPAARPSRQRVSRPLAAILSAMMAQTRFLARRSRGNGGPAVPA